VPTSVIDVNDNMETAFGMFDYAMVLLMVVLIVGLMITSFMIPTHPIFLVINIIGIFILVFGGMLLSNVYGEVMFGADTTLTTAANEFPMMNFAINRLPFIGAIAIFLTSVIMYSRSVIRNQEY